MIRPELNLVSLFRRAVGACHDPCIIHKNIQPGVGAVEGCDSLRDGGETRQVEGEMDDFAGLWNALLYILYSGGGLRFGAGGEINTPGFVGTKVGYCLLAKTGVACRVCQSRNVVWVEG